MSLTTISVREADGRWESLTLSLLAISSWRGVELQFRSINAALGLSFMISSPVDESVSLAWWMTYGRDAFLKSTSEMFGIKLREIEINHAVPNTSPESFESFNKDIKPQIVESISHGKPVIAWQGWPDYHSYLWGIITGQNDSELGLSGTTMWSNGTSLSLVAPPVRLYVVEECEPKQPESNELLKVAIRNARTIVRNELDSSLGVVTGLPAYHRWLAWLSVDPESHREGDRSPNCHYQMSCFVTHNRESALRFLDHYKDGLHEEARPYLEAMIADTRGVINALATSRDQKAVEILYKSEDGRRALAAGVDAAHDFLKAQMSTIDNLIDKLSI